MRRNIHVRLLTFRTVNTICVIFGNLNLFWALIFTHTRRHLSAETVVIICRIVVRSVDVDGCAAETLMKRSKQIKRRHSTLTIAAAVAAEQQIQR